MDRARFSAQPHCPNMSYNTEHSHVLCLQHSITTLPAALGHVSYVAVCWGRGAALETNRRGLDSSVPMEPVQTSKSDGAIR